MQTKVVRQGFTLFIALVTTSIILAIGLSILTITLKEYLLSATARESEMAFSAADAGMECALYWSNSNAAGGFNKFSTAGSSINCMGNSISNVGVVNGAPGTLAKTSSLSIDWGSPQPVCSKIEVTRYDPQHDHPDGSTCPVGTCMKIISRGYNRSCANISDPHAVERALQGYFYGP